MMNTRHHREGAFNNPPQKNIAKRHITHTIHGHCWLPEAGGVGATCIGPTYIGSIRDGYEGERLKKTKQRDKCSPPPPTHRCLLAVATAVLRYGPRYSDMNSTIYAISIPP